MVSSPLQHLTSNLTAPSPLPIPAPQPLPPLSTYPAKTKSSEQWAAKIERTEDRKEVKKRAERARRNARYKGAVRRPFGANGGGPWENWEEFEGEDGGEDDDDGVVGGLLRQRYR